MKIAEAKARSSPKRFGRGAFASGQMGSFLTEFGVTVAVAVIISLVVALTLTPMLASRMPPPKERAPDSLYQKLEDWFKKCFR